MEKTPIHLTVLRKGDSLIIDLDEVGSLIPRSETQVESPFLQELTAAVMRLASPGYGRSASSASSRNFTSLQPGTVIHDLQRVGGLIFSRGYPGTFYGFRLPLCGNGIQGEAPG